MISRLLLLFHTVRYLRPIQIYSRIIFKLYLPSIDSSKPPIVRVVSGHWNAPIQHKESLLSQWKFRFLNEEHSITNPNDWDNTSITKLWRYNLHYFDDVNAAGAHTRIDWHRELLSKWVHENPPAIGSGWEAYPTSLRIVNWIKWVLAGNELDKECLHSLAIQIRWLSKKLEFHILGNHLFANAKALVFAGLFFEGKEADEWLTTGLNILKREVPEQILADGGHFELSPMYHAIVLEDLLDLVNVAKTLSGQIAEELLSEWHATSNKMLHWSHLMMHPDGGISFFNDAAFGIAATFEQLKEYAACLGVHDEIKSDSLVYLADSGYIKVENGSAVGLFDVATVGPDYLPGHAHADTLSFELSLFGQRVFVNSGISQYGNDLVRQKQRSTISHNTVCIDGHDSSEVWAGFRVARRAYPEKLYISKNNNEIKVTCKHNGYIRLAGKCIHEREWIFNDKSLCITDKISGVFKSAIANFYFHPDIKITTLDNDESTFKLTLPSGEVLQLSIENSDKAEIVSSNWYPEFGVSLVNDCISVYFTSSEVTTSIVWK